MSSLQECTGETNIYVIPSNTTEEMFIMTDEDRCYGLMHTDSDTVVLSDQATEMMIEAFSSSYPMTTTQIINDYGCEADRLLADLNDNRIIELSNTAPPILEELTYTVLAGEAINPNSTAAPVIAQYAGLVICIRIGSVYIYVFTSFTSLFDATSTNPPATGMYGIGDYGELGRTFYPDLNQTALGANCNVCGACGGCGACGACALCGGINFSAAAIALVAVDAALAVTSALNAFSANLPNAQ